jgi:membrane-associated phospholipid phosphatase
MIRGPLRAFFSLAPLGICLGLLSSLLFLLIAMQVHGPTRLAQFDQEFGQRLAAHRLENAEARRLALAVTEAGSIAAMTCLAFLLTVVVWRRGMRGLALLCLLIPAGGGLLDLGLKTVIDRPRPEFKDVQVPEENESYPSGHSMGSLVGYGLMAYLIVLFLPRRGIRMVALGCLALLVLMIGFSRMYLGAHFFSDVLGGYALGTAWLVVWIIGMEHRRRRTAAAPAAGH